MSASRYQDSGRYSRDRSPPYRDRRPSNFGGSYPPRANEPNGRPNQEQSGFAARETPRGPKSLGDAPRGSASGPPTGTPSAPRDGRARGFTGRGEDTPLRNAPPLSSGPTAAAHNTHSSWRADRDRERDRDRDFDRRERRPTPPRRSPVRDPRDPRDPRDFGPRDLDVNRARRNSRDGPPSAGSTYSDPSLGAGSSYRGSGIGRGRGGRDFAGRGRPFHPDERDRHHDARDRTWRPRSRSPPPIRRERDLRDDRRDERDIDRRDRDDRRFPREYDSYIGPAGTAKTGPRSLETHRGPGNSDSRYVPGTPTGPTTHPSHHAPPTERAGSQVDLYPRRASIAVDSLGPKDVRREPGKDEALLASRAEASRERYAPRPSSPPAAVPAFGSNVWKASAVENKPSAVTTPAPAKAVAATTSAALTSTTTTTTSIASVIATQPSVPPASVATPTVAAPPAPKTAVSSGLAVSPPTGPRAERVADRSTGDKPLPDGKADPAGPLRADIIANATPAIIWSTKDPDNTPRKEQTATTAQSSISTSIIQPALPPIATTSSSIATVPTAPSSTSGTTIPPRSPPQRPAPKPRAPPVAPQAVLRANTSPQFSRAAFPPYASSDPSPSRAASTFGAPRGNGATPAVSTSPKTLPANIPTGPKADRNPMITRPATMYPPPDRSGFSAPRTPISGGPKSMQWVRPGLIPSRPGIPTKREFPVEDRERPFGTAPKAPKLDNNASPSQSLRPQAAKSESLSFPKPSTDFERARQRAMSAERSITPSSKPAAIETRRYSDVLMAETSPRMPRPLSSTTSSAPEALEDSEDEVDLDEGDFADIEAKYNRERHLLEAKRIDLSAPHLRATTPLHEMFLLRCITVDHLHAASHDSEPDTVPDMESDTIEQEQGMVVDAIVSSRDSDPTERNATELLTPKHDTSDDVDMEDREDISLAPATVALRLRRGISEERDTMPDLSSLPYLGSGLPTPLSDIAQDRPHLSEDVMLAIRHKLHKSIEPDLTTDRLLQQYASVYRQWRINIRPMDEEKEADDPERQPSAEPSLKATTPDISTVAMTGLLDAPLTVSGRRGHSSRWATELDFELVIKESLKTAEEESKVKKDREPRRALADPEKEAELPMELVESEAQRRRYIDTNFQREPGQGIFVFHYEPPEDDFTEEEHRVMVQNYKDQYAKKWGKLAEVLYKEIGTERTYKDCINHYYATKWAREYKGKVRGRRGGRTKRGGGVGRGRGAIANMDRAEAAGEDGLPPQVTETGRPRRSAAPTFGGMEVELDPNSATPTPGRARRQTDADGMQEKVGRRVKVAKEKGGRKTKQMQLVAAAPVGSPVKIDRKDKAPGVKSEDELGKRPLGVGDMQLPMQIPVNVGFLEDPMRLPVDPLQGIPIGYMDRPKTQPSARPGPSSYWSVSELQDFDKNVAHFGTDWLAIANHMGTKTHTMIKNQYLRLLENGRVDLEQAANEADNRRERGDNIGPPPTPTPAPKRRYESTQTALPRQLAPNSETNKSPLLSSLSIAKTTPPHSAPPSRFSAIAQAPLQGKPMASAPGYPTMPETSLASIPSMSQQSPMVATPRTQPQHHHSLSQSKSQLPGPRAGYFSEDLTSRHDSRPSAQSFHASARPSQAQMPSAMRNQDQPQMHPYRGFGHPDREPHGRQEVNVEPEPQRFQQHARRVSQEMQQHRHYTAGGIQSLTTRSNTGARSPEHQPLPYSHSRHPSQVHAFGHAVQDVHHQSHNIIPNAQQQPPRASISTPPVKEEPRNPPMPTVPLQNHGQPQIHTQYGHTPAPNNVVSAVPKPAPEPRKSNLMSLLNDTETEEPRRKKTSDQGPPSHATTPRQHTPIPPPPAAPIPVGATRRNAYDEPQYGRPTYAQQASVPSVRAIDLTNEQSTAGRASTRNGWQQRGQQFHPSQSQGPQQTPLSSHSSLPQPPFGESGIYRGHRANFPQHNAPRHKPSSPPPSMSASYNSPHLHSRTPSISGAPSGPPRHSVSNTSASQHAGTSGASSHILQPNPYAQVEPPGSSAQPAGPMGMRPSPHLHTSHVVQPRELAGRNEDSQNQNAALSYSNPQTPNEHSSHQPPRGQSSIPEPYRPREYEPRHHSDRDTSRELAQRSDLLREQLSSSGLRTPRMQEDLRYQPQHHDRSYLTQRSHTPLSRPEHSQPPPLQHPPHSSLGTNNHPLYGQRPQEEPHHRSYPSFNPRDRSMTERIREEQAQQQAAMNREEHMRREDERMIRDQQMRDNLMRGNMRGPPPSSNPPPPPPTQAPDQRHTPTGPGSMDWASAVGRPPIGDRSWQR